MKARLLLLAVGAGSFLANANDVPSDLSSPDGVFRVEIVDLDEKDSLKKEHEEYDQALVITKRERRITRVPTDGYILDVFWSPDGKYVAVNNRNANSGDYLWIFALTDGRTIKKPFNYPPRDKNFVAKKYPEFIGKEGYKEFIVATGWTKSGELNIKWDVLYKNQPRYASTEVSYKIAKNKLILVRQDCFAISRRR